MIRFRVLLPSAAILAALLGSANVASSEDVICMEVDPATEEPTGGFLGGTDECPQGQTQVGRLVNVQERIVELFGRQVQIPADFFFPPRETDSETDETQE